jgi:hypothetical protein
MSGRRRCLRLRPIIAAVILAVVLAGCQVTTTVAVRVAANGTGTVSVVVVLDHQAALEVGNLAGQLQTSDLVAAGWSVHGPEQGTADTTVVSVSHPFARLTQLPGILAEVASPGTGTNGAAPFVLRVTRRTTSSGTTTTAVGAVDLRCGLSCFGDAGLQKDYGSEVGVNPAALEGPAGPAAAKQDLAFELTLQLPGRVTASNAAADHAGRLHWNPALGASTPITVTAVTPHPARSAFGGPDVSNGANAALAGAVVVVIVALGLVWRRRRRRHTMAHRA